MSTGTHAASSGQSSGGPAFYRGEFSVATAADTYLDTRGWGKGGIWVFGLPLGRFWDIGAQLSSYVPGRLAQQREERSGGFRP